MVHLQQINQQRKPVILTEIYWHKHMTVTIPGIGSITSSIAKQVLDCIKVVLLVTHVQLIVPAEPECISTHTLNVYCYSQWTAHNSSLTGTAFTGTAFP